MVKLHFRKYGEGPPVFILHGLFGSSDNWHTLARRWAEDFTIYAVDLRNHGASPHEASMTYQDMVDDILHLLSVENLDQASFIGHSMGGKTAMLLADQAPGRVSDLIVLDISLQGSRGKHDHILDALKQIDPSEFSDRSEVELQLENYVRDPGVRQFLLKNVLRRIDGSLMWKFNRDVLLESYAHLTAGLELNHVFMGSTLFLRGETSDYMDSALGPDILTHFPLAILETVPAAGHWLHAEHPELIYERVREFLH